MGGGGEEVGSAVGGVRLTTIWVVEGGDLCSYGFSGGDGVVFGGLVTGEGLCSGARGVGHGLVGEGGG